MAASRASGQRPLANVARYTVFGSIYPDKYPHIDNYPTSPPAPVRAKNPPRCLRPSRLPRATGRFVFFARKSYNAAMKNQSKLRAIGNSSGAIRRGGASAAAATARAALQIESPSVEDDHRVYYKNSQDMREVQDRTVDLIVTSPPYFNIKDYSKDGYQTERRSRKSSGQLGDIGDYKIFIRELLKVWQECERALKPNGKLVINSPLMPMKKEDFSTHYNRHIFDLNADIQSSILSRARGRLFLFDTYIWSRANASKNLMFGSYPYPRNFYAQNTCEFITVYVKDGVPDNKTPAAIKDQSRLSQKEWVEYTKQVWSIPIPSKNDLAFGEHAAIMPEEIVARCVKLFSFVGDVVLDPFAGSGTTLRVAKKLGRKSIGYEIMERYKKVIEAKLAVEADLWHTFGWC